MVEQPEGWMGHIGQSVGQYNSWLVNMTIGESEPVGRCKMWLVNMTIGKSIRLVGSVGSVRHVYYIHITYYFETYDRK